MTLSSEQCDAIVTEAAPHLDPTTTVASSCRAWRVPRASITASTILALGVDTLDAQVVRYGPGGGYTWHTDGPRRDRAMVVQLSDPDDYLGGELQFWDEGRLVTASSERGSITKFPSSTQHQACEVLEGERWALAIWTAPQSPRRAS